MKPAGRMPYDASTDSISAPDRLAVIGTLCARRKRTCPSVHPPIPHPPHPEEANHARNRRTPALVDIAPLRVNRVVSHGGLAVATRAVLFQQDHGGVVFGEAPFVGIREDRFQLVRNT